MSHGHEFLYDSAEPTRIGTTHTRVPSTAPDEPAGHGLVPV